MKATSIFGGVQVFNILITLIRGKAVAMLLGPAGMGLNGLFLNGTKLVKNISALGISESAVRDLAKAHTEDATSFNRTYTVFKSWIWFTALFGVAISVLFAPLLSRFAFGDSSQTYSFMFLSATFIFGALSGGIYTMLRATRKVKYMAKANIYGSISGLLVTLPILYVWGIDGVMPSIIAASFCTFLVSLLFRKYVDVQEVELSLREKFDLGKPMVAMGINISLNVVLGSLIAFVLGVFITRTAGLSQLGLYNAANSIMAGYIGMIFTAMSADYFPRLSQAIGKNEEWKTIINQQAEIILLILSIVLSLLIGSVDVLIKVLLSDKFLASSSLTVILSFAIPFKALNWSMGFLYLSKGDSKFFLINELFAKTLVLSLNIAGFHFFGLIGIGISQVIALSTMLFVNMYLINRRYQFVFSITILKTLLITLLFLSAIYLLTKEQSDAFIIGRWVVIAASVSYSIFLLNKRMDLLTTLKRKVGKKSAN